MHADGFLRSWLWAGTVTAAVLASSGCSGVNDGAAGLLGEGASRSDAGGLVVDASPRPADAHAEDAPSRDATVDGSPAAEDASDEAAGNPSADAGLPTGDGDGDSAGDDASLNDASLNDATGPEIDASTGAPDAPPDSPTCTGTLSNVAKGDFDVSFTVTTTQNGHVALLNQRNRCSPSTFWDIRMQGGHLDVEVDDVSNYTQVTSTGARLDNGRPHDVLVQRRSGTLRVTVDGAQVGTSGSAESLTGLAPVSSGVDVCDGQDGTVALSGTIAHVCVNDP